MRWIKATERLPKLETIVCVRLVAGLKLGNFYADEKGKKFFHVSAQDSVADWEIPEYLFYDIEWLDETADDWIAVETALPEKRIRVNICLDDMLVKIGYVDYDGLWKAEGWDFEKDYCGLSKVTRWQPLPSTP